MVRPAMFLLGVKLYLIYSFALALSLSIPDLPTDSIDEIDLPVIDPPFSEAFQDQVFSKALPRQQPSQYRNWPVGWLPHNCLVEANFNHLPPTSFEVRDIWFADCAEGWTVCRHEKSTETWASVVGVCFSFLSSQLSFMVGGLLSIGNSSRGGMATNEGTETRPSPCRYAAICRQPRDSPQFHWYFSLSSPSLLHRHLIH